jgi:cytochrome P450
LRAAKFQKNNRLIESFHSLVDQAGPKNPNVVEFTFSGNPRFILTRDPEHVKTILTSKFAHFGKGARFHHLWSPFLGDSIFTTDGDTWHNNRNLIRPMFIRERVQDLATFDLWAGRMIDLLPPDGVTVDILDLLYRMTLDVTTDFLLGASVNSLQK